jgi:PBSX family phage terminase large subunit
MLLEGDLCPQCHFGRMKESEQRDDDGSPIYLTCGECETVQLTYLPMDHQNEFHSDGAKFKGFFGGYGSGKTRTGAEEVVQHILNTPSGMTLIGAETKNQLDQTAKDMFFKVFPDFMIEDYWKQKDMVLCTNGHVVIFRPLDDEGKLRSLNLTCFWIEEASEVKYEIFVQLQTRLRNKATKLHQGILTSNPDMGWIKSEFLLKAGRIENAERKYHQDPDEINLQFSVHIAPTHLNIYLPDDYVETTSKGKPEWWVKRFMYGSFEHTEGMVYPSFSSLIIPSFPIPKHWVRLTATDFGLRDPTVMLAGAIDPHKGELHLYREHYEAGKSIKYHAEVMKKKILDEIPSGKIRAMVADPKGKAKSEKDMRSTYDYYAEYDIFFEPGINKIEDGILKVFSYMEMKKVFIHDTCRKTIWEGTRYKYPKQDLASDKNASEKPVDKDNHAMDCLKYMIAELPDDPSDLVNLSYNRQEYYGKVENDGWLPHALQEEETHEVYDWSQYY